VSRVLKWCFTIVLGAIVLLAAAIAMWIAVTQRARSLRETQGIEQLADGKGRWVRVDDAALHIQEWGRPDAPVVLLTHGTGAWSGTWFALPDTLAAAGWRVVAIDLPPFGLSTTSAIGIADYTRAAQATRILRLVERLGVPVTLVGHSFGAGPALEAAMQGGGAVRRLVLVDPALGLGAAGEPPRCDLGGPGLLLSNRAARSALVAATATWPGLTPTMLRSFVHRKEVVDDVLASAYRIPFGRTAFSTDLGDWAAAFSQTACEGAASLDPGALGRWSRGAAPVDLIWGAEDTITPLAQGHALVRWMPGARLSVIPDVGHIPHIEDPDAFATALLGVLAAPRSTPSGLTVAAGLSPSAPRTGTPLPAAARTHKRS